MVEQAKQIKRRFIFTEAELKEKLQMSGEIISMGLYVGLSPNDVEEGKSTDENQWFIITRNGERVE